LRFLEEYSQAAEPCNLVVVTQVLPDVQKPLFPAHSHCIFSTCAACKYSLTNKNYICRAQNRRVGRWAKYDTGENPGRWGEAAEPLDDPTAYRLERHGVNVMGDEGTNAMLFRLVKLTAKQP
jgi:hypothetical protein